MILVFAGFKYIFPVADFTFLTLTSFLIAIAVILIGLKGGILTYFASGLLISAIFGIIFALPFILFFGIYPVFKSIIETKVARKILFFVKIILFTVISTLIALLTDVISKIFEINVSFLLERFPFIDYLYENRIYIFIIILIGIFLVYDTVLSSLILFFTKKIQPNLRSFNR